LAGRAAALPLFFNGVPNRDVPDEVVLVVPRLPKTEEVLDLGSTLAAATVLDRILSRSAT
jgi:hypothetical protein